MLRFAAALAIGPTLASCAPTGDLPGEAARQPLTVSGSITYRERIALPPGAQIIVRVDDVSQADAPARPIARQVLDAGGRQVPIAFLIRLDRSQIDPRHSYTVSARIAGDDGRLMFITDTHNGVTFDGRSEVDMGTLTLVMVR